MLQLIEKILSELCENGNEEATLHSFQKLRIKRGAGEYGFTDEKRLFPKICCYAIHELYAVQTTSKREQALIRMLTEILFVSANVDTLRKYLEIRINDFEGRVKQYRRTCKKYAEENGFTYYESSIITDALLGIDDSEGTDVPSTQLTTKVSSKYVNGRQLVTIKTVMEEEVSMYIDVERECPKFVKICMPDHDEPVFVSRVMKKHVSFAKLFDGRTHEHTLSQYYRFDTNESTLEFIDETTKQKVAEMLGLGVTTALSVM